MVCAEKPQKDLGHKSLTSPTQGSARDHPIINIIINNVYTRKKKWGWT